MGRDKLLSHLCKQAGLLQKRYSFCSSAAVASPCAVVSPKSHRVYEGIEGNTFVSTNHRNYFHLWSSTHITCGDGILAARHRTSAFSSPSVFPLFLGSQCSGAGAAHASLPRMFEWRLLCRQFGQAGNKSETAANWRLASNAKLLETRTKLEKAKHKLEGAKQNFMEDIQDTKARMREKMDAVIERENIMTVPNLLCISRIVAAPFLCHLVISEAYDLALGLFLFAGATDLADGWIARVFPSQASKLGSFLDPLADKVLVAALFLSLTYNGLIPIPLTGMIIYRDVAIIAAASYVRYMSLPSPRTVLRYFDATHATVQLSPTTISKVNTAVQLALITATLAQPVFSLLSPAAMTALWVVTIGTTVGSGMSYIFSRNTYTFLSKLDQPPPPGAGAHPSSGDDTHGSRKPKDH